MVSYLESSSLVPNRLLVNISIGDLEVNSTYTWQYSPNSSSRF